MRLIHKPKGVRQLREVSPAGIHQALHRRREAALHAQQALAVALRVLDSGDSDAS